MMKQGFSINAGLSILEQIMLIKCRLSITWAKMPIMKQLLSITTPELSITPERRREFIQCQ